MIMQCGIYCNLSVTDVEESCLLVEQDWGQLHRYYVISLLELYLISVILLPSFLVSGMFEGTGLVKGKLLYEREYEHLQVLPSKHCDIIA